MSTKSVVKGRSAVEKAIPEDVEGLDLTDVLGATACLGVCLDAFKKGELCIDCFMDSLKLVDRVLRDWGVSVLLEQGMISKRSPRAISKLMERLIETDCRLYYNGNRKCA